MADDTDAGAAYLLSLRQSSQPNAAGAAPARALDKDTPPTPSSGPPDRRKSPRYKCEGSARIQEVGRTVATWAKFADISVHGCYVETATPFRSGALLTLKLDANNYRIEADGEVRVVYAGLGMGVYFIKMSEENRSRLRELVRSIAPHSVVMTQHMSPRAAPIATPSQAVPAVTNPAAVVRAILKFFEERHVMGREEFLKILRING